MVMRHAVLSLVEAYPDAENPLDVVIVLTFEISFFLR
jgi:hypothetical protein